MSAFVEFDDVDEFSASVVGQPGSRVFFLNARSGPHRVTVRCEKQQVKAIAMYLRHVLSDLPPPEHRPMATPIESAPTGDPLFVLGPIGLGYDRRNDRLLVQLEEMLESDAAGDDDEAEAETPDRGHIRFYVTRSQADAFCDHADVLVAAGRPSCTWCGNPIDPAGHACPRMN
ncbi:DUF3090 family protein [Desertimonas flava]|uniref:DUF3090 family protein n=1 Tax=Desertimonas flava TaxID=2064846 RepID=UPI000E356C8E|nr:DUF3090 family protein [Desertimonas flava]